jgi:hypothetical protein
LNDDYVNGNLINISKLEILGKILKFVRHCQAVSYRFIQLQPVVTYIKSLGPLMTKDQLNDFSRRCESFHEEPASTKKHHKKEKKKKEKREKDHDRKHSSPIIATGTHSQQQQQQQQQQWQ